MGKVGNLIVGFVKLLAAIFLILCLAYLFVMTREAGKEIFSDKAKNTEVGAVEAIVTVYENEDVLDLAKDLKTKNLINNEYYFAIFAKFSDDYENIRPGDYTLNSSMKPSELIKGMIPAEEGM